MQVTRETHPQRRILPDGHTRKKLISQRLMASELLIGTNASKIIELWEIINSQGEGLSRVNTLVGWVFNRP